MKMGRSASRPCAELLTTPRARIRQELRGRACAETDSVAPIVSFLWRSRRAACRRPRERGSVYLHTARISSYAYQISWSIFGFNS